MLLNALFGNFSDAGSDEESLNESDDDSSVASDEVDTAQRFNDTASSFRNAEQNIELAMRLMRLAPDANGMSNSTFSHSVSYQQKLDYLLEKYKYVFLKNYRLIN